jgi:hypothetical protein
MPQKKIVYYIKGNKILQAKTGSKIISIYPIPTWVSNGKGRPTAGNNLTIFKCILTIFK